jgi:acyl-CoA reductase-like NAD-dependent aldehyde dehydrogenase
MVFLSRRELGLSRKCLTVIWKLNQATLEPFGEAEEVNPEAIPGTVEKAHRSQAKWASWSLERRGQPCRRSEGDRSLVEDLAQVVSRENGKPRMEAVNADILVCLTTADFAIRSMRKPFATHRVSFQNMRLIMSYMGRRPYIQNQPLGVTGIITPWHYRLGIPFSLGIMALAAGNAVILKPTPETSSSLGLNVEELGTTMSK